MTRGSVSPMRENPAGAGGEACTGSGALCGTGHHGREQQCFGPPLMRRDHPYFCPILDQVGESQVSEGVRRGKG